MQTPGVHLRLLLLRTAIIGLVYLPGGRSLHLIVFKDWHNDLLLGAVAHHALEYGVPITNAPLVGGVRDLHNLAGGGCRMNNRMIRLQTIH
jgi:hypothetical protein